MTRKGGCDISHLSSIFAFPTPQLGLGLEYGIAGLAPPARLKFFQVCVEVQQLKRKIKKLMERTEPAPEAAAQQPPNGKEPADATPTTRTVCAAILTFHAAVSAHAKEATPLRDRAAACYSAASVDTTRLRPSQEYAHIFLGCCSQYATDPVVQGLLPPLTAKEKSKAEKDGATAADTTGRAAKIKCERHFIFVFSLLYAKRRSWPLLTSNPFPRPCTAERISASRLRRSPGQ